MVGAAKLCEILPKMKILNELKLADCKLTDKGAAMIVETLSNTQTVKILDLSCNLLGHSSYTSELVKAFEDYASMNDSLYELYLKDNNLRGPTGA